MNIKKIYEEAMEWIFPSDIYCICCGSLTGRGSLYSLCDLCFKDIHWITGRTCTVCGKALEDQFRGRLCYNCMGREHRFRQGVSCMTYGLKERQMILDFKYNKKGYMGVKFGDILADRLCACAEQEPHLLEADVILPVPIHKQRMRERGFNQSAVMARRLGQLTGIPVNESVLIRKKNTKLLRSMDPVSRDAAMRGAFEVTSGHKKDIKGMSILLLDDIMTTGATLDACAGVLLEAGAEAVDVITLASGSNRRPGDL